MDHTKILNLLHIYEKAHQGGAPLTNIRDAAYQELLKQAAELAPKTLAPVDYTPTALDKSVPPEDPPPAAPDTNGETPGIRRL